MGKPLYKEQFCFSFSQENQFIFKKKEKGKKEEKEEKQAICLLLLGPKGLA